MNSETLEHTCCVMYGRHEDCDCDEECKRCDQELEEQRRKERDELNKKWENCRAQRTKRYPHDFDKWSKEAIEKMEEKFEWYKGQNAFKFYRKNRPKGMILQLDDNLNEYEYWTKRHYNEYEKETHNDPDCDPDDLSMKIYYYLEAAKKYCRTDIEYPCGCNPNRNM